MWAPGLRMRSRAMLGSIVRCWLMVRCGKATGKAIRKMFKWWLFPHRTVNVDPRVTSKDWVISHRQRYGRHGKPTS